MGATAPRPDPGSDVERMVLALVYQMEALVDELHARKVVDRDAIRARVAALIRAAAALPPATGGPA